MQTEIYAEALELLRDGIDVSDFVAIAGMLVRLVQRKPDLRGKGRVKKGLVMDVFKEIVTASGFMTTDQADRALEFADTTLPVLIDTLKRLAVDIARFSGQRYCCW